MESRQGSMGVLEINDSGIYETENHIIVYMVLPNIKKENIDLTISSDKLIIEIKSGKRFQKEFTITKSIETDKAIATFKGDILRVEIPKVKHGIAMENNR